MPVCLNIPILEKENQRAFWQYNLFLPPFIFILKMFRVPTLWQALY